MGYVELEVICPTTPWCPACRMYFHEEGDQECGSKRKKSYAAAVSNQKSPMPSKGKGKGGGPTGGGKGTEVSGEKGGGKGGGKDGRDGGSDEGEKEGFPSPKKGSRSPRKRAEGEGSQGKGKGSPLKGVGPEGTSGPQGEKRSELGKGEGEGGGPIGGDGGPTQQGEREITEKREQSTLVIDQGMLGGGKGFVEEDKMDEDIALTREKRKREHDEATQEEEDHSSSEDPSPSKALVVYDPRKFRYSRGKSVSWSSDEGSEEEDEGRLIPLFGDLNDLPASPMKTYDNLYYDWGTPSTALRSAPSDGTPSSPDEVFKTEEPNAEEPMASQALAPRRVPSLDRSTGSIPQKTRLSPTKKSKVLRPKPRVGGLQIESLSTPIQQEAGGSEKVGRRRKSVPPLSQAPPMRTLTKAEKKKGVKAEMVIPLICTHSPHGIMVLTNKQQDEALTLPFLSTAGPPGDGQLTEWVSKTVLNGLATCSMLSKPKKDRHMHKTLKGETLIAHISLLALQADTAARLSLRNLDIHWLPLTHFLDVGVDTLYDITITEDMSALTIAQWLAQSGTADYLTSSAFAANLQKKQVPSIPNQQGSLQPSPLGTGQVLKKQNSPRIQIARGKDPVNGSAKQD
ncbi:hypothetical protein CBR_g12184 [Chara braunii]|uniref:Uncharacterized protein n=1 Tax=Chara braunii TaxID=69332 RepID=A0A388KRB6_CHABU|nr:hypothetical protein CBR_g12184 [Chara braunii]|eukprot:GBG72611.1 hypothetical protein CBR_g12184 [Chara braunii]